MNNMLKDGLIFSLAGLIIVALVSTTSAICQLSYPSICFLGWPLNVLTSINYNGMSYDNVEINFVNLIIDVSIPIIGGFALAYIKNSVMKK